jgi:hypothetical protein
VPSFERERKNPSIRKIPIVKQVNQFLFLLHFKTKRWMHALKLQTGITTIHMHFFFLVDHMTKFGKSKAVENRNYCRIMAKNRIN